MDYTIIRRKYIYLPTLPREQDKTQSQFQVEPSDRYVRKIIWSTLFMVWAICHVVRCFFTWHLHEKKKKKHQSGSKIGRQITELVKWHKRNLLKCWHFDINLLELSFHFYVSFHNIPLYHKSFFLFHLLCNLLGIYIYIYIYIIEYKKHFFVSKFW